MDRSLLSSNVHEIYVHDYYGAARNCVVVVVVKD